MDIAMHCPIRECFGLDFDDLKRLNESMDETTL